MDKGPLSHFPLPAASTPASFRKSYSFVKVQCDTFVGYYPRGIVQKPPLWSRTRSSAEMLAQQLNQPGLVVYDNWQDLIETSGRRCDQFGNAADASARNRS